MYTNPRTPSTTNGGRLVNINHRIDIKYRRVIDKLSDFLDSRSGNVMMLANLMVATGDEEFRGRLMDFVIAVIDAESDAFIHEGDMSWGPTQAMRLRDTLNTFQVERRS